MRSRLYLTPLLHRQYRDQTVARGKSLFGVKENPVPCSDCAGQIVAVGDNVAGWKTGDRVCAK